MTATPARAMPIIVAAESPDEQPKPTPMQPNPKPDPKPRHGRKPKDADSVAPDHAADGGPPPWFDASAPPDDAAPACVSEGSHVNGDESKAPRKRVGSLRGTWPADIVPSLNPEYLVKGLAPAGALMQVYGEPNCGKSAVMLDMACHVSLAMPYRGRRVMREQVAYFALEGRQSIENRVIAWCQHHDIERDRVRVLIVSGELDLRRLDSADDAIRLIADAVIESREPIRWIIIDTQARAMPGASENASEDTSAMLGNCDRIRAATGATVTLIHHGGKDPTKGARGHSNQLGAVDVAIEVADRTIIVRKDRDGPGGISVPFDLAPVTLGADGDGDPVTAVVAVESHAKPARATAMKIAGHAKTALDAFNELAIEGRTTIARGMTTVPDGAPYIDLATWRERFMRHLGAPADPADKTEASRRRNAWSDGTDKLHQSGMVKKDGTIAWRCAT